MKNPVSDDPKKSVGTMTGHPGDRRVALVRPRDTSAGAGANELRILRGGNWLKPPRRSATWDLSSRDFGSADSWPNAMVGFRIVRNKPKKKK